MKILTLENLEELILRNRYHGRGRKQDENGRKDIFLQRHHLGEISIRMETDAAVN